MTKIPYADIRAESARIQCPTLVITTEGSGLGSVEQTRAWQEKIPASSLRVLPGNSHHVAASAPEQCAAETLAFIARQRPGT
jgi:pimeloyl-ACP methyl ester carboxylesterase